MKFDVCWLKSAQADLDVVAEWIHERNPEATLSWVQKIESHVETLKYHPARCPLAPENSLANFEVRQLIIGKGIGAFRVLFEIDGQEIFIYHVRRCAQNPGRGY
jgi:plasmid stabilization system protein ParE